MNHNFKLICQTAVILLSASGLAFSQSQKLKFERISIEQGLSQSTVACILQDSKGFMWFGTNNGLNKYDGYHLTVYKHDPNNPNSLSGNEIWSIVEDAQGALWIGTWGGGLNRFDRETETFTSWQHDPSNPQSLSDDYVTSLHFDSCHGGVLWIGTEDGGLNRLVVNPDSIGKGPAPQTVEFTHWVPKWVAARKAVVGNTDETQAWIASIFEDRTGDLWMEGGYGGLHRFDRETETFDQWVHESGNPQSISLNFIDAICEDPRGNGRVLWIATHGGGLNRFDIKTETFTHWLNEPGNPNSLSSNYIYSMYADSSDGGMLWIGTDGGGLNRFDLNTETFTHWISEPGDRNSLSDNEITAIYEDRTGVLWIGTLGGGICKLNRNHGKQNRFIHWRHDPDDSNSLSHNDVSSIYEDRSGHIWVGTYGGGLNQFDPETGTFQHWLSTPKDTIGSGIDMFYPQANNIAAIHEDYNKTLWIGTYGGKLLQFNRESNTFVYWPYGLNMLTEVGTKYIMSFYEDRADSGSVLWIGTHSAGLAKLTWDDRGIGDIIHWQPEPGNPESINNFDVRCIHGDDFGRLWLGTAGGGLNIFGPKTEQFAHLVNEPGNLNSLSSNFVKCIYASANDSGRVLWIGTDAGLDKLVLEGTDIETVKFFHYKAKDGLPSEYICGILEDDNGYLWLSTIKGLSRFDPRTDTFRNYDIHDGLQGNEFTTGAALKSLSGEMFFGGINGFNSFYPDSIRDNPHFPPVVITDFQISNESVGISQQNQTPLRKHISETDEIVLSHRDNVFSFEFAALDYNTSEKNQYAYRMEGFDEDWIYSGTRRFATYTNLDPGEYVFRVKGSNNDGVWNEEGTSVRIIVTPPWWKTWWAYTLYVILIGALFYGYRRFELSKVRLANDLKMQQLEANKLREIDHIKSRFFANISHEFRAPLTLILGPLKRLLSGDFQGDPKDQFRLMLRNGQRLLLLITQLLDLSKLEAGRMFLKARPENIVKVLINIVSQFESLADRKKITLQFQPPEGSEPSGGSLIVYFDRDKLEKIMYNLLSNAFKFTPEGGEVSVSVDHPPRSLPGKGERHGGLEFVEIIVADSGIVIPPDHLDKIFDRFYQVDSSNTREQAPSDKSSSTGRPLCDRPYPTGQEGTGIGLALTKELVELHRGEIHVRSEPGRGTAFVVRLPLGKEHLEENEIVDEIPEPESDYGSPDDVTMPIEFEEIPDAETTPAKEEDTPPEEESPIILIVEDNCGMRTYISEILGKVYGIVEAGEGVEGFDKAVEVIPDLVISDVVMPRMDGFKLCHKLKTDERTSHIPVILLTARASGESKVEGLETGADDYVTKPFDTRELAVRVKNLIEQRRKLRERFSREITLEPRDIAVTSMDEQFLQRATDIIEQQMADPDFSIETFTKKVGMSRMQVHRKLRALTDQSTSEFIRTMRLKRAAQLLKQHSGTVAEIAYEVGFNNLSYFARCFRDLFGQLPSEYAQHHIPK